jgi:hypothetical protein
VGGGGKVVEDGRHEDRVGGGWARGRLWLGSASGGPRLDRGGTIGGVSVMRSREGASGAVGRRSGVPSRSDPACACGAQAGRSGSVVTRLAGEERDRAVRVRFSGWRRAAFRGCAGAFPSRQVGSGGLAAGAWPFGEREFLSDTTAAVSAGTGQAPGSEGRRQRLGKRVRADEDSGARPGGQAGVSRDCNATRQGAVRTSGRGQGSSPGMGLRWVGPSMTTVWLWCRSRSSRALVKTLSLLKVTGHSL